MAYAGQPNDSGGDWWTANAPPDDGGGGNAGAGSDPFADQINALYQQYYGRAATDAEIQAHRGNPGGVAAVEQLLKSSQAPAAAPAAPPSAATGDDALRAQIAQWAAMLGADPSLSNDPEYWVRTISAKGGLTDANRQYWQEASVGPTAFFNNPNREQGGAAAPAAGGARYGDFQGTPPSIYASDPNAPAPFTPPPLPASLQTPYVAPTWTGGDFQEPALPANLAQPFTAERYTAPTLDELKASPGYLARLDALRNGQSRYYAGRGLILNPGTQVAIDRASEDYSSSEYGNLVGQKLAGVQTNNASALAARGENVSEFQNVTRGNALQDYLQRYGQFLDSGNLALGARNQNASEYQGLTLAPAAAASQDRYKQFMDANARTLTDYNTNINTQRNSRNDYWTMLNDLARTGADAASGSYKPGLGA